MSELADKERKAIKILRMYRGDDPIKAMDSINENALCVGGNLYAEKNIMGSIRVATFCKKKEE